MGFELGSMLGSISQFFFFYGFLAFCIFALLFAVEGLYKSIRK